MPSPLAETPMLLALTTPMRLRLSSTQDHHRQQHHSETPSLLLAGNNVLKT